jgi:hypothetical protein
MDNQHLKSYLEEQLMLKRHCIIKFRSVEGAVSVIKARIISLDSVSGRDMIETDAGLVVGLDQLLAVNDQSFENYC